MTMLPMILKGGCTLGFTWAKDTTAPMKCAIIFLAAMKDDSHLTRNKIFGIQNFFTRNQYCGVAKLQVSNL